MLNKKFAVHFEKEFDFIELEAFQLFADKVLETKFTNAYDNDYVLYGIKTIGKAITLVDIINSIFELNVKYESIFVEIIGDDSDLELEGEVIESYLVDLDFELINELESLDFVLEKLLESFAINVCAYDNESEIMISLVNSIEITGIARMELQKLFFSRLGVTLKGDDWIAVDKDFEYNIYLMGDVLSDLE